ncbi:MBG domain-containing protein [Companilactobacillus baiquanensis]|uniref:MBG domain-containing protein n=1 Tax=Companilactobacillus baiquanensis TaxID=2486005 RepID=UPI000F7B9DE3|nr:MBG domain-containing protein [Companilactobacillus baiquanensis]
MTDAQKASAYKLLQSVADIYEQVSDKNGQAKTAFENAKTDTVATDIYKDGQTGYENIEAVQNLLVSFEEDLDSLKTTNKDAQNSLATFDSWVVNYGDDIGFPKVSFGPDFGTVSSDQIKELNNPDYYEFYTFGASGMGDTPVTPKDVGRYIFKLTDAGRTKLKSFSTNENAGLYVSGTLTINPKDVVANVNSSSVVYGDTPKISGELDGTAVDSADFEIYDNTAKKVVTANQLQVGGDYSIRYTSQAQADLNKGNYEITKFNTGKLTVNKRPLTITASDNAKTYGDDLEPELVGTADNLVNGDTLDSIGVKFVRASGKDAGQYEINADTSSVKNYQVTVNSGNFIIGKKPVTVTADPITKVYGEPNPTLTFTVEPGSLVGDDTKSDLGVTLTCDSDVNFGSHDITGTSDSANYNVTVNPGKLTITKAPANLTINKVSITYGDTPTFTSTIDAKDATNNLEQSDFEVVDSTGKAVDSGFQVSENYTVQLKDGVFDKLQKANPNYEFSTPTGAQLTVNPKDITVTAADSGKTYGEADPAEYTLTGDSADGLVTGDTLADLGVELSRVPGEDADEYKISGTAADSNYRVTVIDGTFTINPKQITVTAANDTKVYGQKDPTFTLSADSASQLVNNDKLTDLTLNLTSNSSGDVGEYKISGTAENSNYIIKVTPGTFTITPASADIKIEPTEVVYGSTPVFSSYSTTSDVTDNLDQNDYEVVDSQGNVVTTRLQVGETYKVQLKAGALDKLHEKNPNYDFSNPEANTLVVTPKNITVTAADSGKTYGEADPAEYTLTGDSADGLVTGDTLADLGVELSRATGKNVGDYKINLANPSELNKNYNVTFKSGNFSITKKAVTVVAADGQKTFGDPEPTLELTPDSAKVLEPDDNISNLDVTLSREKGEDANDYQITGTSNSQNYQVTVTPGTFTITPASATVNIDSVNMTYGDQPSFSATVGVGQMTFNQSDFEIVDGNKQDVNVSDLQAGGNYSIKLNDAAIKRLNTENPNYKFGSITPAKLNVAKRPIIVTIDGQSVYVGENDPENNAVLVKPRIGDDNLLPSLNLSYNEPDSTTVGTYDITASSDNPNFDITFIPGKLIVLGKDVDKDGNVTITEKDKDGNVTKVTKQWNDDGNKETVYNYDPATGTKTVTETNDGKTVDQQTIDPTKGEAILPDSDGAATVVSTDDSNEPKIIHYQADPDKDGLTSADELIKYGTDPLDPDSDKDGVSDGDEVKNGTDPLVPNYSNQDTAKVVMKNQTVGTTTKMVKLYDKDGNLIEDRMLGVNTDWRSDEEYTLNDVLYYRVSTNEFVKASDVYVYLYQGPTFIRVYNDEKGNLVDYTGSPASRSLAPSSEWRTDRIAIINGQNYYRVSTDEFVPVEKVYEYQDSDTVITTNSETTAYNERGKNTDVILPANTAYKVDKVVVINGVVNYRVSTNEFIKKDMN